MPARAHLPGLLGSAPPVAGATRENGGPRLDYMRWKQASCETLRSRYRRLNPSLTTTTDAEPENCPFPDFDRKGYQISEKYASESRNATQAHIASQPTGQPEPSFVTHRILIAGGGIGGMAATLALLN